MKFCGATIIAACLAGTAIAMPTMAGPMFNNKQMELIEMINNNRVNIPMDQKTAEMLDGLMDIVRWQQAGMPAVGGPASDVAAANPTSAMSAVASAVPTGASGLLGGVESALSGVLGGLGGAASAAPTGSMTAMKRQQSATTSSAAAELTGAGMNMDDMGDMDAMAAEMEAMAADETPEKLAARAPPAAGAATSAAMSATPATPTGAGPAPATTSAAGGADCIFKIIPIIGPILCGGGDAAKGATGAVGGATKGATGAAGDAAKGATGAAGMAKRFSGVVGQEIGI
ncbi:hypothetical protein LMH87_010415 [Akanthomyces muscarius]|uniref:Cell wall protein n=1 Tax=Akanthomyces muscarius TaxID=2231603 RepID=A0A9W8QDA0_AKAMU|nr:hypothetical protein LMH87_010415 [Akanthomyces muscarius]KAJ4153950.1 hypothetical protein LMH87_010415 [Akanthomyces muscarius]